MAGPEYSCFRHPEERLSSKVNIPLHIFTPFINQAIEKKDMCPISMEILTKKDVASTPCGHLFQYDSLKKALQTAEKCPTCRAKCNVEDIQYI